MKPNDLFLKLRGLQVLDGGTQQGNQGGNAFLYTGAGVHTFRILPKPVTDTDPITPDFIGVMSVVDTPAAGRTVTLDITTAVANMNGSSTIISNAGPGPLTITTTTGPFNPAIILATGESMEFVAGLNLTPPRWVAINFGGTSSGGGTVAQQKGAVTFAGKVSPTDTTNFKLPAGIAGNSGYDLVYLYYDLASKNADVLIWPNGVAADPNAQQWQAMPLVDYNFMGMFEEGLKAVYEPKRKYTYFKLWPTVGSGDQLGMVKGVQHTQITAMCVLGLGNILVATADANATQGALWESNDFGRTWELQTINIRPEGYKITDPPYPADHADIVFSGAVESIIPGKDGKPVISMNYTAVPGQEKAFVYVFNKSLNFWNEEGIDENTKHNYDTLTAMGGSVIMVAASPDCTVMQSRDNGDSWKTYVSNLEGTGTANAEEVTRMIHSGNGELLAAVNPGGVLNRIDAAKTVTKVFRADNAGGDTIHDILDFGGSVVILAVGASKTPGDDEDFETGNIYRSTDNGATWSNNTPVTQWKGIRSTGRFIDFGLGHTAIAIERITTGVEGIKNSTYETWYSDDQGETWQQLAWNDANNQSATPGISKLTARLGDMCLVYYPGKGLYRETRP